MSAADTDLTAEQRQQLERAAQEVWRFVCELVTITEMGHHQRSEFLALVQKKRGAPEAFRLAAFADAALVIRCPTKPERQAFMSAMDRSDQADYTKAVQSLVRLFWREAKPVS